MQDTFSQWHRKQSIFDVRECEIPIVWYNFFFLHIVQGISESVDPRFLDAQHANVLI